MRLVTFLAGLLLLLSVFVAGCGGDAEPTPALPTSPPAAAPFAPASPPTRTPEPTPTPLSLSDLGGELRTFVNETHQYAIQVPIDWQILPRGAGHADRVEVTMPGPTQIRGPNILPPLVLAITALGSEADYTSLDDVEARRSLGDDILGQVDLEINGLPARRIESRDAVYGDSLHYIIQGDDQFFLVDVRGYDQAPAEPVLNTFGPPPALTTESITGQVLELDGQARTMMVVDVTGSQRQVVWFTDTEILPRGRLEGHIDAGDRVSVEGIVVEGDEIQARSVTLQAPEHAAGVAVLEFQQVGSTIGLQARLVVFDDGTAQLERGDEEVLERDLPEDQWKQVKNYVSIFKPFAWHSEDNQGGTDNLVMDLDFYGEGKFEALLDNQQVIVSYLQQVLATIGGD